MTRVGVWSEGVPTDGLLGIPGSDASGLPCSPHRTPLFGRAEELAEVARLLDDTSVRLVTLTGRAGVGKTRLAHEIAARLETERGRPVPFVSLASVPDPDLVLSEIASVLEVRDIDSAPLLAIMGRLAIGGEVLLLDHFDHLRQASPAVRALLEYCPNVQLLVTSALPLHLSFERVVRLDGLPVPRTADLAPEELAAEPTVALYCERARAADHRFELDEQSARGVVALCRALEGFPLAIELAAARARTLSASEIVRRSAREGLDVLHATTIDTPSRHHALRAAIESDFELLGPRERTLLLYLAVAEGRFDLDDVDATGLEDPTSSLDALEVLVDLGLVERDRTASPPRFRVPSSVVEFVRQASPSPGEIVAAESRWVGWLARRARAAATALTAPGADARWRWIGDTEGALVRAADTCIDAGRVSDALDLLSALCPHWAGTSPTGAHRQLVARALTLARVKEICTRSFAEVLLWFVLIDVRAAAGSRDRQHEDVSRWLRQARDLVEMFDDGGLHLLHCFVDTLVASAARDLDRAMEVGSQGRDLAARMGSDLWMARFEIELGAVAHARGHAGQALELGYSAIERATRATDSRTTLLAGNLLLSVAQEHHDVLSVLPPPEELLRLARSTGQASIVVTELSLLADQAVHDGRIAEAASYCLDGLALEVCDEPSDAGARLLSACLCLAAANGDAEIGAAIGGHLLGGGPPTASETSRPASAGCGASIDTIRAAIDGYSFELAWLRGRSLPWCLLVALVRGCLRNRGSVEKASVARPTADVPSQSGMLTDRQLEVVQLLAGGLTNKEIARHLGVSTKTVMHHTGAIYSRLGVRGRSEAVGWAARQGLMPMTGPR